MAAIKLNPTKAEYVLTCNTTAVEAATQWVLRMLLNDYARKKVRVTIEVVPE